MLKLICDLILYLLIIKRFHYKVLIVKITVSNLYHYSRLTFTAVKSFFKYCLILLTLVGFAASTFELDKEEFKQNFKKEDHTYITSSNSVTAHDFKIDHPAALPVNLISLLVEERFVQQTSSFTLFPDPDPPERLYIRYSVFRI